MKPYRTAVPFPKALRTIAAPFIVSRGGVLLLGLVASVVSRNWPPASQPAMWRVSSDPLPNMLARWDTFWYFDIATRGYRWNGNPMEQQNVVFFPLLPMLIRIGGRLLGGHPLLAGLIVSLVTFPLALAYLWRWTAERHGEETASATVVLLCAFPFSVFFSAVYTESIFLLAAIGAWHHTEGRSAIPAVLFGFAAGLTRPNGFMLVVPLAWLLCENREGRGHVWTASSILAAPILGMLMYTVYLQLHVGAPWAWIHGQAAWGANALWGGPVQPGPGPEPFDPWGTAVAVGNGAALALAALSLRGVSRRVGIAAAIWIALSLLFPVARHGLLSVGRFTSVLFPLFVWLAVAFPTRRRLMTATFAIGQSAAAILFFTWRPLV